MDEHSTWERFWLNVQIGDACWEWLSRLNSRGYGWFDVSTGNIMLAHRFSYSIEVGPIPEGLCVLHKCDTPKCVRPSHLFLGTRAENNADKIAKGRAVTPRPSRGEANGAAKLTNARVLEIRSLYASGAHTKSALARLHNVSPCVIGDIVRRELWRHI